MSIPSINWKKLKRQILSHPVLLRNLTIIILTITALYAATSWLFTKFGVGDIGSARAYVEAFVEPEEILTNYQGRTNILVMGIGGQGHEGAVLTDSMMFVSIALDGSDAVMLPIPRDIWIPSMQAKVNTAVYYGEQKQLGGGLILAKSAVSEIVDQPIHYAVILDFSGFVKLIDSLGGIQVDVANAFTDSKYPIPGKENAIPESDRYETISFTSGPQHMDGTISLKFVRSRNAQGIEGTDVARSERQKRVITAIRQKLFETNVIFNFEKLQELYSVVEQSVITDIPSQTYAAFARLATRTDQDSIRSVSFPTKINQDEQVENPLFIHPELSDQQQNQWVLIPAGQDFDLVHQWTACQLEQLPDC